MVSAVIDKTVPVNNVSNNSTNGNLTSPNDHGTFWFCGGGGGSTDRDPEQVLNVAFALTFLVGFCQVLAQKMFYKREKKSVIFYFLDNFRNFTRRVYRRLSF